MKEKQKIKIEQTYRGSLDKLWELWTTKEGIESWWGPQGFKVEVHELDLRPGGKIRYSMIAVGPDQIKFMKEAGMPIAHEAQQIYVEIVPKRRLVQRHSIDFIPEVKPYETVSMVEFHETGPDIKMVVTLEPMHNEEWTEKARMGWESQLQKLPNR